MEDSKIIELFLARDEEAIKQTDMAYGRRLHHLADGIVCNEQDAEESVSDTYRRGSRFLPESRNISSHISQRYAVTLRWTSWIGTMLPSARRRSSV